VWKGRYGNLASTVTRLPREVQTSQIAERVRRGELKYGQGERLAMFLDLERLGLAQSYYPKSVYSSRKREATKLGYSSNDSGGSPVAVDMAQLLTPYLRAVEGDPAGVAAVPRL
jgi:hypothetical protein